MGEVPIFHTVDKTKDRVVHSSKIYIGNTHLILDSTFDVLKTHLLVNPNRVDYKAGFVFINLFECEHIATP